MGGKVLNELLHSDFLKNNIMKGILIVFFIVSFSISPIKASLDTGRNNLNRDMYILGNELSTRYDIQGNIASNRERVLTSVHDSWHKTFRLAYWLQGRYYGQARDNISDEDLVRELRKYEIDYYFFWGDQTGESNFLSQFREITNGDMPGLHIYSLNEKK